MAVGACASCSKVFLVLFTLLFWVSGVGLLCFGVWMLVDPKRSYILDLVNFAEADPLLKIATYIFIAVGCVSIVVGFVGCCGALKEIQCFLCTFSLLLFLILSAELTAGVLAYAFRQKFSGAYMSDYLRNLTHDRYGRDGWVRPFVDTVQYYISASLREDLRTMVRLRYGDNAHLTLLVDKLQFYQQCCGSSGPQDWRGSYWQSNHSLSGGRLIPASCCVQLDTATFRNQLPHDGSGTRCMTVPTNIPNQWRNSQQACCGSKGPLDYRQSWWQTELKVGALLSVPKSCCTQTQESRPPDNIQPIDPYCDTYRYGSDAFKNAVHQEGCHAKLSDWFDKHCLAFILLGVGIALFQLFGIILSICLCRNVGIEV